jgi:hypothetical protein
VLEEMRAVVARAKAGDESAVPRLREFLDRYPAVWRSYGDLAAQAQAAWVALAAGRDLHLRECLTRFAADQRAQLVRPGAGPLERLLAERAVACALQLNYATLMEAQELAAGKALAEVQWWSRRQAQAARAYESALGALLTAQRLLPAAKELPPAAAGPPPDGHRHNGHPAAVPDEVHNRLEPFLRPGAYGQVGSAVKSAVAVE